MTRRARLWSILGIGVGATISAEFLQSYLSSTGDVVETLAAIAFLAPMYGGVALLIREVAVRRRLGWSGIVLLGTAFGVAMPGVIDLALFGARRDDISYWPELREPTLIPALGISGSTTLMWVVGHAVMSVAAPLAIHDALAPSVRGQSLLSRAGIVLVVVLTAGSALLLHLDGRQIYGYTPSVTQACGVVAVTAVVAAAAFSPLGRRTVGRGSDRAVAAVAVFAGAVLAKVAFDLVPLNWGGVAAGLVILSVAAVAMRRLAGTRRWTAREIGLLGAAAVVAGALIGFTNPTPDGISTVAKLAQNAVVLLAALLLAAAVGHRTRPAARSAADHAVTNP